MLLHPSRAPKNDNPSVKKHSLLHKKGMKAYFRTLKVTYVKRSMCKSDDLSPNSQYANHRIIIYNNCQISLEKTANKI